ncbi:protein TsetseEP-like [Parambassis ranga]|uniref:Protein TsetseEP-like n=1 Tax=Parambassis ranga TaxID=210632 RepID=A0A6P7KHG5_9TELE|nr:protein TsetseEP-like [Parambassis ranga]
MGNRLSRRRDVPAGTTEAIEQKTTEGVAATPPAEDSATTQTQEIAENLEVVVGEPVTEVACVPGEECVSECKEEDAPAAPVKAAEPELLLTETTAQVEPLVAASNESPPEPKPEPTEAQLTPESAQEPVPEPESSSNPEADIELVCEPIIEPTPDPAEALEQQTELLAQDYVPEPEISSAPLVDLGVPDVTPFLAPIQVNADDSSDIPIGEQGSSEAAENSTHEPEKPAEPTEPPTEVEAAVCLEKPESDVNEESVCEILKNLELKGNDHVSDLMQSDVNIPDDTPITDMSTSTELM